MHRCNYDEKLPGQRKERPLTMVCNLSVHNPAHSDFSISKMETVQNKSAIAGFNLVSVIIIIISDTLDVVQA